MIGEIGNWVLHLTGAALLTAAAMALTPKGRVRAVVGLTCGLVTIAALVRPVLEFDYDTYAASMATYTFELDERGDRLEETQKSLTSLIIREQSAAYILDKAESLDMTGLDIVVDTALDESGGAYPYQIWLTGRYTGEQQRALADYLTGTFGIPGGRQYWSGVDGTEEAADAP